MENNQQSFWQFSDKLRLQTPNFANLSVNDSIWSNSYASNRSDERRNFDIRVGGEMNQLNPELQRKGSDFNGVNDGWKIGAATTPKQSDFNGLNDGWKIGAATAAEGTNFNGVNDGWKFGAGYTAGRSDFNGLNDGWKFGVGNTSERSADFNGLNDGWKIGAATNNLGLGLIGQVYNGGSQKSGVALNGGFNKGVYSKTYGFNNNNMNNISSNSNSKNNFNLNFKGNRYKGGDEDHGSKFGKKNTNKKNNNQNGDNNESNKDTNSKNGADKRFKTLPPSESLPRNETVGGYIFVCNNDTMQENLQRQLFGLPPRYRDSVRAIKPGLPLFLYNYSTHQLHGIFEAASFGGANIDPSAWEDKKTCGESRFPAQVRVMTRKVYEPLEEDSFRPILHHYDGPKFRLELSVPEALSLLDRFEEENI